MASYSYYAIMNNLGWASGDAGRGERNAMKGYVAEQNTRNAAGHASKNSWSYSSNGGMNVSRTLNPMDDGVNYFDQFRPLALPQGRAPAPNQYQTYGTSAQRLAAAGTSMFVERPAGPTAGRGNYSAGYGTRDENGNFGGRNPYVYAPNQARPTAIGQTDYSNYTPTNVGARPWGVAQPQTGMDQWDGPYLTQRNDMMGGVTQRTRGTDYPYDMANYPALASQFNSGQISASQFFAGAMSDNVTNDRDAIDNATFSFSTPPRVRFAFSGGRGSITGTGIGFQV